MARLRRMLGKLGFDLGLGLGPAGSVGGGPTGDARLLEDGTSYRLLEDSTSYRLKE